MPRKKSEDQAKNQLGDEEIVVRVRAALAGLAKVNERRMFGGTGFMVRGNLCVTARRTRIMCRIAPSAHSAAIKRNGVETVIMKGREYRGYVYVDTSALKSEKDLLYWVGLALEFNRTLPEVSK